MKSNFIRVIFGFTLPIFCVCCGGGGGGGGEGGSSDADGFADGAVAEASIEAGVGGNDAASERDAGQDQGQDAGIDAGPELMTREKYCKKYRCWTVPDTGQISCYDGSAKKKCPAFPCKSDGSPDYCGQDAQYGGGKRHLTESKVGSDSIVTDATTGLVWQGSHDTDKSWQDASDYCDELSYAGFDDWGLPDINELASLVNFEMSYPASDFAWMPIDYFWSSTGYAAPGFSDCAWRANFVFGVVSYESRIMFSSVRCVRRGKILADGQTRFRIDGKGDQQMVSDLATGLVWQFEKQGDKTWKEALLYCEKLAYGGPKNDRLKDWRLPNVNELRSLLNYNNYLPTADFTAEIPADTFWSSSTDAYDPTRAWIVDFGEGGVGFDDKNKPLVVMCVRGESSSNP